MLKTIKSLPRYPWKGSRAAALSWTALEVSASWQGATTALRQPPWRNLWAWVGQAKHFCPPLQGLLGMSHHEHWLKALA